MDQRGYFSRAAASLFGDRSWLWRSAALAVLDGIPYLGSIITMGYMMVMMRDTAWGARAELPRFSEYSEVLKRGVHGFVISLVWGLAMLPVIAVVTAIWMAGSIGDMMAGTPANPPWWFASAIAIPAALLTPFIYMATLRASIYVSMSAGLSVSGVRSLIGRDSAGFKKLIGPVIALSLLGAFLGLGLTSIAQYAGLGGVINVLVVSAGGLVGRMITMPLYLIVARAYGLWAADNDPATWPPLRPSVDESVVPTADAQPVGLDPL